jgi:hypothetical protein
MCWWSGFARIMLASPRPPVTIITAMFRKNGSCRAQPSQRGIACTHFQAAWKLRSVRCSRYAQLRS